MKENLTKVTVLGAGSWGTALAIHLARKGHEVTVWGHKQDALEHMVAARSNNVYLPGVIFPETLRIGGEWPRARFEPHDTVVCAIPSVAFRQVLTHMRPRLTGPIRFVCGTKGFDPHSSALFSEVTREILGSEHEYAVLSGPSFAKEVAANMPTAVVVASDQCAVAESVAQLFASHYFRTYVSDDLTGVQFAGAAKNIIAIAVGISDGLGFGANARSALITRGLAEITRLGVTLGARQDTFLGLAGVGDLVLTCTDDQSRNRRMGLALGRGSNQQEAKISIAQSVEGMYAAEHLRKLAEKHQVDVPIAEVVYRVLHHELSPAEAVEALLSRSLKAE